jgi:hypothetical protein
MAVGLLILLLLISPFAFAQNDNGDDWGEEWADDEKAGLQWAGFIEGALGSRWTTDPQTGSKGTLREVRVRVETDWVNDVLAIGFKGDALYDDIVEEFDVEIRNLTLAFSPGKNMDVKIGQQVLTWGTGDLLFLNDLFPKDWVSFFAGRDTEYLKAPSCSARFNLYTSLVNVDFVWTPVFEPDNYLSGERFSFFSPLSGEKVAPDPPLSADEPKKDFENGEFALRLFRTFNGTEYALYGYRGFFKQPLGLNDQLIPDFPPLISVGASLRRNQWSGLFNTEVSYYFSRDDRNGTDPLIPNDQFRLLLGFEREAVANFNIGVQYFLEWTQDHDQLIENSLAPEFEPDEYRHLFTTRLTWRTMMDHLIWSVFVFYSPSDKDYYLRPKLTWRYSDQWTSDVGLSLFGGAEEHTFFGQLDDNSNAYARVRYHF